MPEQSRRARKEDLVRYHNAVWPHEPRNLRAFEIAQQRSPAARVQQEEVHGVALKGPLGRGQGIAGRADHREDPACQPRQLDDVLGDRRPEGVLLQRHNSEICIRVLLQQPCGNAQHCVADAPTKLEDDTWPSVGDHLI